MSYSIQPNDNSLTKDAFPLSLIHPNVLENIGSQNTHTPPLLYNIDDFVPGKFMYISNNKSREMLVNAWNIITKLNKWDFIKDNLDNYMINDSEEMKLLQEKLGYDAQFSWIMKQMQYIAQNGEEQYMYQIRNQRKK